MKKLWLLPALVFLFAGSIASAQAKGYAGVMAGMSVPDYEDTSARPAFGILGGARLDGEWGFGGFYLMSNKKESVNNVDVDFDYSLYGIEGSFHMEGVADGAYIAARVGLAKVETGVGTAKSNYSPMVWGIHAGYDHFFTENFSAGIEAGFMSVAAENKSPPKADLDSFTMINFLVATKFWF